MIFPDSSLPTPPPAAPAAAAALLLRVGAASHRIAGARGCEIARCPPLAPVPGAPGWLLGVVVHKGEALPLVDLAAVLADDAHGPQPAQGRMLVFRGCGCAVGFLVDDVDADDGRAGALALDLDGLGRVLLARASAAALAGTGAPS